MGIPYLYRDWLSKKRGVIQNRLPTNVSSLSFDLNGIIHKSAQEAIDEDTDEIKDDIIRRVNDYIMNITSEIKPIDTLYIAVDGVAPVAKIQQQRQRRYKSSGLKTEELPFDTTSITPGTDFMFLLNSSIDRFLKSRSNSLYARNIHFSGPSVKGEGEHKIMEAYKGPIFNEGSHIIYGKDADLILLALLSPLSGIYIDREDTAMGKDRPGYINIDKLKDYISEEMGTNNMLDFVLIVTLIGNDFLPNILSLKNINNAIETMIEIYNNIGGNLTDGNYIKSSSSYEGESFLNWDQLNKFLKRLSKEEGRLLYESSRKSEEFPNKFLEKYTNLNYIDLTGLRKEWYSNMFLPLGTKWANDHFDLDRSMSIKKDDIIDCCKEYFTGLVFVLSYYVEGLQGINSKYFYPYLHAPMVHDLSITSSMPNIDTFNARNKSSLPSPLEQLVAVIPKESVNVVPSFIRELWDRDSPIGDYFPTEYYLSLMGISEERLGTVLIPFVNMERISYVLNGLFIDNNIPKRKIDKYENGLIRSYTGPSKPPGRRRPTYVKREGYRTGTERRREGREKRKEGERRKGSKEEGKKRSREFNNKTNLI
jgi:5'-3' exonuclease